MNASQLASSIAETLSIPLWDATSRVEFNISELELDPENIGPHAAAEIERMIAGDIRRGK